MKPQATIKFIFLTLIILFISLYFTQMTGFYEYNRNRKTTLTENAIKRFEEDIANGKEIKAENYLIAEKNYSNTLSKLGMKISKYIEKGFDKAMNTIFSELNKVVTE